VIIARIRDFINRKSQSGAQPAGYLDSVEGHRVTGWAWNPRDPLSTVTVEFLVDGRSVFEAKADKYRSDLVDAGVGDGHLGFDVVLPAIAEGVNGTIIARVKSTRAILENCPFNVGSTGTASTSILETRYLELCKEVSADFQAIRRPFFIDGPQISILTPVYNVAEVWLRRAVESVMRQSYGNWQLCLVDDSSTMPSVREAMIKLAQDEPRISTVFRDVNGGIAAATNSALLAATGEYVALLDNDDMLTCNALEEMVSAILANSSADYFYSDECMIDEQDQVMRLFAKPDWSPLLMLNCMYTGHLSVYRKSFVERLGAFRSDFDFSQDYDLALRAMERTSQIVHVEKYLYGWRMIATSAAADGKPEARISNIAALQAAIDRRGWDGKAVPLPACNRVIRTSSSLGVRVSIIIPSDNAGNIEKTVHSIREKSSFFDYEIIVVTNSALIRENQERFEGRNLIWANYDKPYNFSDKCNHGASLASGAYVFFFNDDVRVISNDWIEILLEYLTLPGVGAASPKLLYENGLIQHAGMITGVRRLVGTAFHCLPADTSSHFNFAQSVREVTLLSGALLCMSRELFLALGGFNSISTPIAHSDVDLCLRINEAGYRCVYVSHAQLTHIGHHSLAETEAKAKAKAHQKDKADIFLLKRHGEALARDRYFTRAMRDIAYSDSQELFSLFPGIPNESAGNDVLILTHDLTSSGAPKVALDIASMLSRSGSYVVVVSPEDGALRREYEDLGITVIIDPLAIHGHSGFVDLAKNFDIVIANTAVCWRSICALQQFTKVYWYIHETNLLHDLAQSAPEFSHTIANAPVLWAGSEHSAEALRQLGGTPVILEYGVDDLDEAIGGGVITIALLGSFEPRKGQDLAVLGMLEVDRELRRRARLKIAGRTLDKSFREAVEAMSSGFDDIEFGGELTYRSYLAELQQADIVIIPSRSDTLPLVSLDTLMLSKPLICSNTTGTANYLVHGESALILQHNSPSEIAEMLTALIEDPVLRRKIGQGGRQVFERFFSRSAFERRILGAMNLESSQLSGAQICAS
jgi:O-antigen biosynthesis protein